MTTAIQIKKQFLYQLKCTKCQWFSTRKNT